jgi:hypothetical protein
LDFATSLATQEGGFMQAQIFTIHSHNVSRLLKSLLLSVLAFGVSAKAEEAANAFFPIKNWTYMIRYQGDTNALENMIAGRCSPTLNKMSLTSDPGKALSHITLDPDNAQRALRTKFAANTKLKPFATSAPVRLKVFVTTQKNGRNN